MVMCHSKASVHVFKALVSPNADVTLLPIIYGVALHWNFFLIHSRIKCDCNIIGKLSLQHNISKLDQSMVLDVHVIVCFARFL